MGLRARALIVFAATLALLGAAGGALYTVGSAGAASNVVIEYSTSPNRSNPASLDGATISGTVYVFVPSLSGIKAVTFNRDNGQYVHTEHTAPWDLMSGQPSGAAPWYTTSVGDGAHTIVAIVKTSSGTVDVSATFGVGNSTTPTTAGVTTTTAAPTTTTIAPTTTTTIAPTTTTTIAPTTTTTVPSTSYLFDDEFGGTSLDVTKWQPNWLGGSNSTITPPINGAEASCYDPKQVTEPGDGLLHLAAAARSCTASNGKTYAYASGLVNTHSHFTFTAGHLEARVWLDGANGTIYNWPAVWTDGTGTWPSTGESDVMEGLSGQACFHYHSPSGGPGGCVAGNFTGWHTFGETVQVTSSTTTLVTYYYDGVKVGSETGVNAPHYIILNLGVGGYGGPLTAPSSMLVDYLRVTP